MLVSLDVSTLAYPDSKFINLRVNNGNIVHGYYININDESLWSIKSGTLKPLKKQRAWSSYYTTIPEGYDISTNGRQKRISKQTIRKVIATTAKKPEPVLLDESTKQQASAWESIFATLQKHVPGWNDPAGTSRGNACKIIEQLSNDSKALHNLAQNKVPGELYIQAKIPVPETVTKKSIIFCYDIKACFSKEDVKSEIDRVVDKLTLGLDGRDKSVEVVEVDIVKRRVSLRWVKTITKEHLAEYARIKLQQIIRDYIGEQK